MSLLAMCSLALSCDAATDMVPTSVPVVADATI